MQDFKGIGVKGVKKNIYTFRALSYWKILH